MCRADGQLGVGRSAQPRLGGSRGVSPQAPDLEPVGAGRWCNREERAKAAPNDACAQSTRIWWCSGGSGGLGGPAVDPGGFGVRYVVESLVGFRSLPFHTASSLVFPCSSPFSPSSRAASVHAVAGRIRGWARSTRRVALGDRASPPWADRCGARARGARCGGARPRDSRGP